MKIIEIGGRKRPVKYSINALIELEEITGIEVISGSMTSLDFAKLKTIRALAYVGLKYGHKEQSQGEPDFTIETVGDWMVMGDGSIEKFLGAFHSDTEAGEDVTKIEEEVKK